MVVMSGVGLIDNLQRGLSVGGAKAVRFHANTAAHATLQDVLPTTALTRTDGEDDGPSRHFQLRNGHIQTVRGHNGPTSVTVTVTSQSAASRSAGSSSGGGTAGRSRSGSPVFPSALRSSGTAAEQWAASGSELQGLSLLGDATALRDDLGSRNGGTGNAGSAPQDRKCSTLVGIVIAGLHGTRYQRVEPEVVQRLAAGVRRSSTVSVDWAKGFSDLDPAGVHEVAFVVFRVVREKGATGGGWSECSSCAPLCCLTRCRVSHGALAVVIVAAVCAAACVVAVLPWLNKSFPIPFRVVHRLECSRKVDDRHVDTPQRREPSQRGKADSDRPNGPVPIPDLVPWLADLTDQQPGAVSG